MVGEKTGIVEGPSESIVNEEDGAVRICACYVGVVVDKLGDVACGCAFPFEAFEATGLKCICHGEENERVRISRYLFCSMLFCFWDIARGGTQLYNIFPPGSFRKH